MKIIFTKAIVLAAGLICSGIIHSQDWALQRGDQVPDREFSYAWNTAGDKIKLSDYKGKLIILDFWTPRCLSCLESFPYMDSLQKTFNNDIQIILVSNISTDSTERFFKRFKKVFKPSLPIITGDKVLNTWFPHEGVPFHVWIDKNGVLVSTANPVYTTIENIKKVIRGHDAAIPKPQKKIYTASLFDERWRDLVTSYSYISKWKTGLHLESEKKEGYDVINFGPVSVTELYQYAWDGLTDNQYHFLKRPGITLLEAKEPIRYIQPKDSIKKWGEKYWYQYQLRVPQENKGNKYSYMKQDLERYFGLHSSIERRQVACFALTKTGEDDKLQTKGGTKTDSWDDSGLRSLKTDTITQMYNQPFELLLFRLKNYIEFTEGKPFVDLTEYKGNIDIEFNDSDLNSLTSLRRMLRRYGLAIAEKNISLYVLILKEGKDEK